MNDGQHLDADTRFRTSRGFLGSVFTWIFSRRKQNNDFLKELQSSINLLSGENKKILEENIQLRRENIDLKANQEECSYASTG